jgi:hypothetical protein
MSMNRTVGTYLVVAVVIWAASGCAKSNRLIGKWKVSAPTSSGNGTLGDVPCSISEFEFTPTTATLVQSAAWSNGADPQVTRSVVSYNNSGDDYSVTLKGGSNGNQVVKFHIESGGISLLDGTVQTSRCAHFVPDN